VGHGDFRPAPQDAGGSPVEAAAGAPWVGPEAQGEQIRQAERGLDVQSVVGFEAHADREHRRDEALQRLAGAGERRIGLAEMGFEPDMHTRLVAHVDGALQSARHPGEGRDLPVEAHHARAR
jgi:hypothetical protein